MKALEAITRVLYPDRCPGCGRFGTLLCDSCAARLPLIGGTDRCAHCRARWADRTNCPRCFGWLPVERAVVACDMDGVARRLVHGLKYRGVAGVATIMAEYILHLDGPEACLAVAVPLHPGRERQRGFNQAEVLLDALGWSRLPGRLSRVRRTATQVGMRERERRRNVAGAFAFDGPEIRGRNIALVDDVITTGATVTECATILKEHGAGAVVAVAFARAHYEPGRREPIYD